MTENATPELTGIKVEMVAAGKKTQASGSLLGASAFLVQTDRREAVGAEVELRFRPKADSPEIVAQGVVDGQVGDKGLRVRFTEMAEKDRRYLLELFYPPGEDRRTARRASLVTQIRTLVDSETLVGYTRDISTGGVFVETENPAAKGTEVNLRFKLSSEAPILGTRATVVYSMPGEGMGLRFVELVPEVRKAIEEFVREQEE